MRVTHEFEPVFNGHSRVLVLGTLPSVRSREGGFYYHHPKNRFWQVMAAVLGVPVPVSIPEKREMLLEGGIAVWDVVSGCDIEGSDDSSIRNVTPADLTVITDNAPVRAVFANGAKAAWLYERYSLKMPGAERFADLPLIRLPSTSPANARWGLEVLTDAWRGAIVPYL